MLCVGSTLSVYPVGPVGPGQGGVRHFTWEFRGYYSGSRDGSLIEFYSTVLWGFIKIICRIHAAQRTESSLFRWHPLYQKPKNVVQNLCLGPRALPFRERSRLLSC